MGCHLRVGHVLPVKQPGSGATHSTKRPPAITRGQRLAVLTVNVYKAFPVSAAGRCAASRSKSSRLTFNFKAFFSAPPCIAASQQDAFSQR